MGHVGSPVHFELNSSDASSGEAVPAYRAGSTSARGIGDDDVLCISTLNVVSENGGDVHVFLGEDATPGTGETVFRGNLAANGGASIRFEVARVGAPGHTLWVDMPAGQCDVTGTGAVKSIRSPKHAGKAQ